MLPYPHLNFLDTSRSHSSDEASTFAMRDGNRRLGTYASTSQDSNSQWFLPRHLSFYTPEFSSLPLMAASMGVTWLERALIKTEISPSCNRTSQRYGSDGWADQDTRNASTWKNLTTTGFLSRSFLRFPFSFSTSSLPPTFNLPQSGQPEPDLELDKHGSSRRGKIGTA